MASSSSATATATMNPFSMTIGCAALLGAIARTTNRIAAFNDSLQQDHRELIRVESGLQQLEDLVVRLHTDSHIKDGSGHAIAVADANDHTKDLINDCLDALAELNRLLDGYRGSWAARYTVTGKGAVECIGEKLSACVYRVRSTVSVQDCYDSPPVGPVTETVVKKKTDAILYGILDNQLRIGAGQSQHSSEHMGLAGISRSTQQARPPTAFQWATDGNGLAPPSEMMERAWDSSVAWADVPRMEMGLPCDTQEAKYISAETENAWMNSITLPNWEGDAYMNSPPSLPSDRDWSYPPTPIELGYTTFPIRDRSSTIGSEISMPKPTDPAEEKIREDFKQAIWASTGKLKKGTNPVAEQFKEMVQKRALATATGKP